MVKEGMLTKQEALLKIKPEMMDFFLFPSIDPQSPKHVIAKGLPASPGAKTGMIVFNPDVRQHVLVLSLDDRSYCLMHYCADFLIYLAVELNRMPSGLQPMEQR
jgi:phosphoenolpyruvate synthase/pyruvate phosphate dikinase